VKILLENQLYLIESTAILQKLFKHIYTGECRRGGEGGGGTLFTVPVNPINSIPPPMCLGGRGAPPTYETIPRAGPLSTQYSVVVVHATESLSEDITSHKFCFKEL
jgi:hypothetical protein